MYSLAGRMSLRRRIGLVVLVSAVALILTMGTNRHTYAAQIGPGAFTVPTIIDFEDAPAGPIGGFYSALGVTMVDLDGGITEDAGTGNGSSKTACNFGSFPHPPGELLFSPPVERAGFFIITNNGDDTTVTAFLGGSPVGSETFVTGLSGSFAGVEFGSPFDRLVIDPADNVNGAFCIDDLRFERTAGDDDDSDDDSDDSDDDSDDSDDSDDDDDSGSDD